MSKWCQPPLFIKIFTFATGTSEAQKLFLASPVEGDVSQFVIFGFKKQSPSHLDSDQFKQIVSALSERNAENLFYFTDNPKKAIEAKKAGLTVFVVCREGNQQYTQQELNHFNVIKSFDQLDFLPFQWIPWINMKCNISNVYAYANLFKMFMLKWKYILV